jgi:hypothetical protein
MSHARALAALLLLAAPASCGEPVPAEPKPTLHLLTSLPLLFGEDFALDAERPAVTEFLERKYRLVPVDLPSELPARAILLAVQPRALPPSELVALDDWVRSGGRLVLLADPFLEWPSGRPLGDRLRPPVMFADTGLLGHWGLRLDSPDRRGPVETGAPIGAILVSPGELVRVGGECRILADARYAECHLGHGRADVVADVDWLNVERDDPNLPALEKRIEAVRNGVG